MAFCAFSAFRGARQDFSFRVYHTYPDLLEFPTDENFRFKMRPKFRFGEMLISFGNIRLSKVVWWYVMALNYCRGRFTPSSSPTGTWNVAVTDIRKSANAVATAAAATRKIELALSAVTAANGGRGENAKFIFILYETVNARALDIFRARLWAGLIEHQNPSIFFHHVTDDEEPSTRTATTATTTAASSLAGAALS